MRFVVATHGAEGDARPFAALCRGLIAAGREAAPERIGRSRVDRP